MTKREATMTIRERILIAAGRAEGKMLTINAVLRIAQERGDHQDDKFIIGYNAAMRHVWTEVSKLEEKK